MDINSSGNDDMWQRTLIEGEGIMRYVYMESTNKETA